MFLSLSILDILLCFIFIRCSRDCNMHLESITLNCELILHPFNCKHLTTVYFHISPSCSLFYCCRTFYFYECHKLWYTVVISALSSQLPFEDSRIKWYLHIFTIFMFFICSCWSKFPSGVTSPYPKEFSFTFLVIKICQQWILFLFIWKYLYFAFICEGCFCRI